MQHQTMHNIHHGVSVQEQSPVGKSAQKSASIRYEMEQDLIAEEDHDSSSFLAAERAAQRSVILEEAEA